MSGPMSSSFYRTQDAPKFLLGHALELAFIAMGIIATLVLRFTYIRINKEREANPSAASGLSEEELSDMGDRAPTFRYHL